MLRLDAKIHDLAAVSHSVLTIGELQAAGVDRSAIHRRVRAGSLMSRRRGVYVVGSAAIAPSTETTLMAAVREHGPEAWISHTTAAARAGIWHRWDGVVHVTTTSHHPGRSGSSIRVHRTVTTLPDEWTTVEDGIPMTSPAFTCTRLGTQLSRFQIAAVIGEGRFRGLVDPDELEALLGEVKGSRGLSNVRSGLALHRNGSAGTRSRSEEYLIDGFDAAGIPEPFVNVRGITGHPGIEPDMVWYDERLIVEVDGDQHRFEHARTNDEDVDDMHADDGWLTLRYTTAEIWHDRPRVLRMIRDALQRRRPRR